MELERRFRSGFVETQADGNVISGLGAVFYREGQEGTEYRLSDRVVERIMPGAFDASLESDDILSLFNHDHSLILARTSAGSLRLKNGRSGVEYVAEPGDTTTARDVREYVRRGEVTGSSIGFVVGPDGQNFRTEGDLAIREIRQAKLMDIGPVTLPAYAATTAEARVAAYTGRLERARRAKYIIDAVEQFG